MVRVIDPDSPAAPIGFTVYRPYPSDDEDPRPKYKASFVTCPSREERDRLVQVLGVLLPEATLQDFGSRHLGGPDLSVASIHVSRFVDDTKVT